MLKSTLAAAALTAALGLAACGTTPTDRGLSGAGLGALGGAAIGSFSGNAGAGAVVGAVAGGVVGAATSPNDIYLGEPLWRRQCLERQRNGEHISCAHRPH